jgi:hypothetical protein
MMPGRVASPEERRAGDPETTDNPRVSISFLRSGIFSLKCFGKTHAWVASPEEPRDGDPETTDKPRVSIPFLWAGI